MATDKTEGVFRPILSLSVNWQSTFCLNISTLGNDESSTFYFDGEMEIMPELSKIKSTFPFMNDSFKALASQPGIGLFGFIKGAFEESGITLPAIPPKHIKAIG
jgi:hypothetical protein